MTPTNAPFSLADIHTMRAQVAEANEALIKAMKARSPHVAGVKLALAMGADIDAFGRSPNGKRRTTALNEAIRKKSAALLEALLAGGADPNTTDAGQMTALGMAAKLNVGWAVAPLAAAGGDPNQVLNHGRSVLSVALETGADDVVEALVALPQLSLKRVSCVTSDFSYLFEAHTARSVKALVAAGLDTQPSPGKDHRQWHVADWLMSQSRSPAGARPHSLATAMGTIHGLVEVGLDDPAPALEALIEAGAPVSDLTLLYAARKAVPRCLKILDAQGLKWSAEALKELARKDPALAQHWHKVLNARAQSAALQGALPGVEPTSVPSRPRI